MLREIVLDTETTGTDALKGDRIVEIGCIELLNHIPSGKSFHVYLNPERAMSAGAFAVHGLSDNFLADKPLFATIAEKFETFIGDDVLVIHNAPFDIGFLNAELARAKRPPLSNGRVLDTLLLARRKHPGASNSLDALCTRYGIDRTRRDKHGALLDAQLLADVYLELIGGRQTDLGLGSIDKQETKTRIIRETTPIRRTVTQAALLTEAEKEAHLKMVASLGEKALWKEYSQPAKVSDRELASSPPVSS